MNSLRKFDKSEIVSILEKFFTHRSFLSLSRKWKLIVIDEVADLIMQLIDMQQEEIERLRKRIEELEGETGDKKNMESLIDKLKEGGIQFDPALIETDSEFPQLRVTGMRPDQSITLRRFTEPETAKIIDQLNKLIAELEAQVGRV